MPKHVTLPVGDDRYAGLAKALAGRQMFFYGDSLSMVPGARGTIGQDWPSLLKRALNLYSVASYAVGGSTATDVALHVINSANAPGRPGLSGGKWDGTRRGIVSVTLGVNDSGGYTDMTVAGGGATATDAKHQSGITGALRAILATLSSASRVEVEAGVLTGTWASSGSGSGGSYRYTQTVGDKADIPVVFPSTGKVHLVNFAFDPTTPGGVTTANATIAVDGVVQKTITTAQQSMRGFKTAATPLYAFYTEVAFEVNATPGAHTITVTHAGNPGESLAIDCVMVNSPTAPLILFPKEYDSVIGVNAAGVATAGQLATILANKLIIDPLYQAVCAEFPNVYYFGPLAVTAGGVSTTDNLHPNDRGHYQIARTYLGGLVAALDNYDSDNTYNSLSALVNPPTLSFGVLAAWPLASGTNFIAPTSTLYYISGGSVTSVAIDDVVTGLTSGPFIVPAGHRIKATYTVAPNYTAFDLQPL